MNDQGTPKTLRIPSARYWARTMRLNEEIDVIREYVEAVTRSFAQVCSQHEESMAKFSPQSDEEAEWQAEAYAEVASLFGDRFPALALESTFITTYAFLEDAMMDVARLVGGELKLNLDPAELSDKGIRAARKYLEKLCGVSVPPDAAWQKAVAHGQIRNCFAHARGRVKKDNQDVRRYVAANQSLISIESDRLRLTKDFCLEVLNNAGVLLRSVLMLAQNRNAEDKPSGVPGRSQQPQATTPMVTQPPLDPAGDGEARPKRRRPAAAAASPDGEPKATVEPAAKGRTTKPANRRRSKTTAKPAKRRRSKAKE